jgi:hypothetical protein
MGRDCASERIPIALAWADRVVGPCVDCCGAPTEGLWERGGRLASPMARAVPGEGPIDPPLASVGRLAKASVEGVAVWRK